MTPKPHKESASEEPLQVLTIKALIEKAYKDLPELDLEDENPVSFQHLPDKK